MVHVQGANVDRVVDSRDRRLIDLCKDTSLCVGNGCLHKDIPGDFIFRFYNGSSMVDYLLFGRFSHFQENELKEFSDHCAVSFSVNRLTQGHKIYT